jgi:spermidine/putrescine-binding protein
MKFFKLLFTSASTLLFASVVNADSITVVSWGGAYTKSQVEAYHKPWSKKTGHQVVSEDYSGGLAEVKAQVESGNVTWDVVDVELSDALQGCDEGILEEIDHSTLPAAPDGTPAAKDFLPGALQDCAVGNIVWTTLYAYDKTKFVGHSGCVVEARLSDERTEHCASEVWTSVVATCELRRKRSQAVLRADIFRWDSGPAHCVRALVVVDCCCGK